MKKENQHHRNTKNHRGLLQATICQKMDNLEEMDKFFKKLQLSKTECVLFCSPMDYNPLGSSDHRFFQARIPEQVAISYSKGFS